MPPEFLQMFPYVATVAGLMLVGMSINRQEKKKAQKIEEKCRDLEEGETKEDDKA